MAGYNGDLPSYFYFGDQVARHLTASTSYHEASHAMLGKVAGLDMGQIEVLLHFGKGAQEICSEGYVELEQTPPPELPPDKHFGWLIACAGGVVGQAMWYVKVKPGYDFDRAMAEVAGGACHDEGLFERFNKGTEFGLDWRGAQLRARQMLEYHWPFVDQFAKSLAATGSSHGSKVPTPR